MNRRAIILGAAAVATFALAPSAFSGPGKSDPRFSWGNQGFHYGSGYDIYGKRQAKEGVSFGGSAKGGWTKLYNGKDLTGWHVQNGKMECWKANGEMISCVAPGGGWLTSDKQYGDYELKIDAALAQANATANLMKQLLAALRLPDEATGKRPQVRAARGAYTPSGKPSARDRLKAV